MRTISLCSVPPSSCARTVMGTKGAPGGDVTNTLRDAVVRAGTFNDSVCRGSSKPEVGNCRNEAFPGGAGCVMICSVNVRF